MQPSELHKVEPSTLLRFARAGQRGSRNLCCNGDVHWAELNNGLNTEWKAHPGYKVQGTSLIGPVQSHYRQAVQ